MSPEPDPSVRSWVARTVLSGWACGRELCQEALLIYNKERTGMARAHEFIPGRRATGQKISVWDPGKRLGTKGLLGLHEAILVDVTQNKLSPWSFCNWTHPVINTGSLEAWESTLFRGAQTLPKWNLDFSRNDLCGWHANLPLEWRWRNMWRNEPRTSCWKQNCYLHQVTSLPGNS